MAPRTTQRKTILAVASGGGHFVELVRLSPAFAGNRVVWVTVSSAYKSLLPEGAELHTVTDVSRSDSLGIARAIFQLARIVMRTRPDVAISTGALPGLLALGVAKLSGARTIWLDSLANAGELSMSGAKAKRVADLWLTQWPELAERVRGLQYAGSVLDNA